MKGITMKVTNDPNAQTSSGPAKDLLNLQIEFHARLGEETIRYLRRLQATLAPASPGTVVRPGKEQSLVAVGYPEEVVKMSLDVENRQAVHCMVTPMLSTLVDDVGTAWFPAAEFTPGSALLGSGEKETLNIALHLPADLPTGTYRGTLLLIGFRFGGIPVEVRSVARPSRDTQAATKEATEGDTPKPQAAAQPPGSGEGGPKTPGRKKVAKRPKTKKERSG